MENLFFDNKYFKYLFLTVLIGYSNAIANPSGGNVVGGNAAISANGSTLTVNQITDRAVINWNTFSIANGETTRFIQPTATSAVLNRVTGANLSEIYGTLSSNGQVYLINPNGILIGSGGIINTAGFIASTLDVSNNEFMAGGDMNFIGNSTAALINAGKIGVDSGNVYLIAREVKNSGEITAPNGEIGLAGGTEILLKGSGSDRISILAISAPGSVENAAGGAIKAAAASLKAAGGNEYALAVNNGGVIQADGVEKINGKVILFATNGKMKNTGTITAKNADGKGGFIETSGEKVEISGTVRTGNGGEWLIDPMTIDGGTSVSVATLQSQLDSGNVTETATNGITLDEDLSWTGIGVLTLKTTGGSGNIALSGAISASNGGLNIDAGSGGSITASAGISVKKFTLSSGSWSQISGTLPTFDATDFTLSGGTFLRATGGDGSSGSPYLLADVYGLQGMAASSFLSKSFALANDIDANVTSGWNGGAGFVPIGNLSSAAFTGTFDGNSHIVDGLYIHDTSLRMAGLFGYASNASIANVEMTDVHVDGGTYVGALIGYNYAGNSGTATIANVFVSSGSITASSANLNAGGLIGFNYSDNSGSNINITGSRASCSVTGTGTGNLYAGGLIGFNQIYSGNITVSGSHATGAVTATGSGDCIYTGGLIGYNYSIYSGANKILVSNSYATGDVSGTSSSRYYVYTGGLIGYNYAYYSNGNNVSIVDSYATGRVVGTGFGYVSSGGLVGVNYAYYGTGNNIGISNSYATGNVTATGTGSVCVFAGGLVGENYAVGRNATDVDSISIAGGSYASGSVTGTSGGDYVYVGGLIGYNYTNAHYGKSIINVNGCSATGAVSGTGHDNLYLGGLVGLNYSVGTGAKVGNCSWNPLTTGQSNSIGYDMIAKGSIGILSGTSGSNSDLGDISDSSNSGFMVVAMQTLSSEIQTSRMAAVPVLVTAPSKKSGDSEDTAGTTQN